MNPCAPTVAAVSSIASVVVILFMIALVSMHVLYRRSLARAKAALSASEGNETLQGAKEVIGMYRAERAELIADMRGEGSYGR